MPNYNYLPNNKSDFPHIENVDTYKYDNDFDYGRFDYDQMRLQVCTVPWDMGEAHIGNRTISGIGNVVYFGGKAERDAWFAAIPDSECYRFTTKFKELHRDGFIDVPIPYDMCAKHNYLVVHYEKFANENSPVMFEGDNGLVDWFWFIREVEFLAPNTTRLHIMDDAWCTWIYDVTVKGMVLERGHAPMFAVDADTYLENPLNHNQNLLTEDVNYGEADVCKHIDALALNAGDMWACIATTANPQGTWGTKAGNTWRVPARPYNVHDGVPSVYVFGIEVTDLDDFLNTVNSSVPQFAQTVQGVFFASKELVSATGSPFTFAGVTCHLLAGGRKTFDFVKLDKSQFGYREAYADIAKLYTSPYAHIEVTDENGEVDVIKIENTDGEIDVYAIMSLAYPFVNIDAHLMGVDGNRRASVTYRNISARTFTIEGRWYETLRSWNVPTFAIIQEASVNNDYATHFDRAQAVNDYTTAYDNAEASADAQLADRLASALANKHNADRSANANYTNEIETQKGLVLNKADAKTNANTKIDDVTNGGTISQHGGSGGYLSDVYDAQLDKLSDDNDADIILMHQITGISNDTLAAGAVANAGGTIGGGIASGAAAGASIGPYGAAAGGVLGGIAQAASVSSGTFIALTNNTSLNQVNVDHANAKFVSARDNAMALTEAQKAYNTGIKNADNAYLDSTVDRFSGEGGINRANASRTKSSENDNATETYETEAGTIPEGGSERVGGNARRDRNTTVANAGRDRTNAQNAIANDIAQAALNEPMQYGAFAAGESAVTRPIGLFAHIVTQSASAIASAGDEFLRYGYMLDRQWSFDGNWNIGKYFTYWKLKDFWVSNLNVPDMYMDRLRFFLFGGVTVWRKPEDIGHVTVYDNFNG